MTKINNYDLIIVGAGMAGLSAGISYLQKERGSVLVIEKNYLPGGYVTAYSRDGYIFDTIQLIPDITHILKFLGVKGVEFKRFDKQYMKMFLVDPNKNIVKEYQIPDSLLGLKDYLSQNFSEEKEGINKFLLTCEKLDEELYNVKLEPSILDKIKILKKCPTLVKSKNKTLKDYFDKFEIKDSTLREIFSSYCAFSGLPPDQVSCIIPMLALASLGEGAYRPKSSFKALPDALEEKYLALGGDIKYNSEVIDIIIEDRTAKGIKVEEGTEYMANDIISTIDVKRLFNEFVGMDLLKNLDKKYAKKVQNLQMSYSSINIELGMDKNINLDKIDTGYGILTTGNNMYTKMYDAYLEDRDIITETAFHLGVIATTRNKEKPYVTIRVSPAPSYWVDLRRRNRNEYNEKKEQYANFIIDIVSKYLDLDLKKHIVLKDVATPATYSRYSGSPTGSIFAVNPSPDQTGLSALSMITPIKNLYHGINITGVLGALLAGIEVVDFILEGGINENYARLKRS